MGKAKKTRKFAAVKRRISPKDDRLKKGGDDKKALAREAKRKRREETIREHVQANSSMFFQYNTNIVPPYQILVDTNFVNAAVQIKTDILKGLMDCLLAKCVPCVTDCVVGELEKLGHRYRLALALAKDRRFKRLTCCHQGTYADDCIVRRVTEHKCYIVATNDKDLKRRIRKIPGVPIIYVKNHKFAVERLPDAIAAVPSSK